MRQIRRGRRFRTWIIRSLPNFLWPLKVIIIKAYIPSKGRHFRCGPNCLFHNPENLEIGHNVFIADGAVISNKEKIYIGNNVLFGPDIMIRGGDHRIDEIGKPMSECLEGGKNLPIIIESDVWIGARVIILKGVKIAEGAVIGAGAVVSKSIPPYTVAVGNPCRPIKARFTRAQLEEHLKKVKSAYQADEVFRYYAGLSFMCNDYLK